MSNISDSELKLFCGQSGGYIFNLMKDYANGNPRRGYPFVCITADGEQGFCAALTSAYRDRAYKVEFCGCSLKGKNLKLFYHIINRDLKVTVSLSRVGKSFVQTAEVKNEGSTDTELTALFNQIRLSGYAKNSDGKNYSLYYCRQDWYREGEWRCLNLDEAGVEDNGGPLPTSSFEINGLSSQTTARYFPNIYLSDRKRKICMYCETEPAGKWFMRLGLCRDWWKEGGEIILSCGSAEDRSLQFCHTLKPGETYRSAESIFGRVRGGICDAVKQQYAARRARRQRILKKPQVIFNDYMNCLWGDPDEEKCLRLAETAKRLGADIYVTDAGWFKDKGQGWSEGLGVWKTDSDRFEGGLEGFSGKLRKLGLIPGVWTEIECCSAAVADNLPEGWLIDYRASKFGNSARKFFNFTDKEVREYLYSEISAVIRCGVRYIKNDYNDSFYGFGNESAYMTEENLRAFYCFIDRLYEEYPDLIAENCASGALRSDGNTLKHFALQSISDQDDYRLYPSVIKGSLMNIIPEQLGIWCMPHPVHCAKKSPKANSYDLITFNLVSALTGVPYFSGRIDLCSNKEEALIAYGIKKYKEWRSFIQKSSPRFPLGLILSEDCGWDALELVSGKKTLLYIWRLDGPDSLKLPYSPDISIKQEFPAKKAKIIKEEDGIRVVLAKKYTAAVFSYVE